MDNEFELTGSDLIGWVAKIDVGMVGGQGNTKLEAIQSLFITFQSRSIQIKSELLQAEKTEMFLLGIDPPLNDDPS